MEPEWIGIVGTGVMGFGLARLAATKGFGVVVTSATPGRAEEAAGRLRELLEEAGGGTGPVSTDPVALWECLAVLEATTEDLAAKHRALAELEPLVPPEALVATTTSSLSV